MIMEKILYRVEKDDTLFSIAQKFSASVTKIISDNNLTEQVSEGDLLLIEKCRVYAVRPLETIDDIVKKFDISKEEFFAKNKVEYVYYGLTVNI